VTSILFALLGAAVVAVFVYLTVDQIWFIKGLLGTDMLMASAILLIVSGGLLMLSALVAMIGACSEQPKLIAAFVVLLSGVILTLLACIICTLVFRTWLAEQVRNNMVVTLTTYYGVNVDGINSQPWNKQVTEAWDAAQSKWQCCSVRDNSWAIYRDSNWYRIQPGTPDSGKPFVPASCCVRNPSTGDYKNLKNCQTQIFGPPNIPETPQYSGLPNNDLYYRGCYETGKDHLLNEVTWYLIGTAVGVEFFGLMWFVLGLGLLCTLKREVDNELVMMNDLTSQPQTVSRNFNDSYPYRYN